MDHPDRARARARARVDKTKQNHKKWEFFPNLDRDCGEVQSNDHIFRHCALGTPCSINSLKEAYHHAELWTKHWSDKI